MKLKGGYLFLEMAIVVGLIILLVCLAVPHMSFMREAQARAELDNLYHFFRFCAQRAMVANQPQELQFDSFGGRYSSHGFFRELSAGIIFGAQENALGPPSSPQTRINHPISFHADKVTFYPDGSMQSGAVYITDASGNFSYCLTAPVGAISYLRKYRYDNGQWKSIR